MLLALSLTTRRSRRQCDWGVSIANRIVPSGPPALNPTKRGNVEGQRHSFILIINVQSIHSALPQRQLLDQALRFVIFGEPSFISAKSLAMRQTASIDGHTPVFFV